jgi:hypothetical protein
MASSALKDVSVAYVGCGLCGTFRLVWPGRCVYWARGARKWQPRTTSRINPAADVYQFCSLARDAFHIIGGDVLGGEMRRGYVDRAETEEKRQQRLKTTHANWMDYKTAGSIGGTYSLRTEDT